ncbi:urease accessory protein [Bradyrhizobium lablabi]|uniref:Urease accessory protein n=1 Tax=Bradyrhizobium lablabi TaxID=722472 RepID=A0A1M6SBH2_9BRAD|nr:HupE/UreJ family protein [Bradyrhizobium lablabi]SHK41979.1 urease accessory protein [Bradyrhizobium lablabi]
MKTLLNRSLLNKLSVLVVGAAMLAPAQALAHHMMGGKVPVTFMQGLLSGLGHPIIGLDHFAAVVGVGILAALLGRGVRPVLAFSAAMILGVALHLASANIPAAELLVGLSTLLIGGLVALRLSLGVLPAAVLFAAVGVFHGYALGESIVGAEASPLGAYLAGLFVIQTAIAVAAYAATTRIQQRAPSFNRAGMAAAGALIALIGAVMVATAGFPG